MIAAENMPLAVNQECRLGVPDPTRLSWHDSRVMGRDGQLVWVQSPAQLEPRLSELRGTTLVLETYRRSDAQYAAHADLVAIDWTPPFQLGLLLHAGERIQRRDYVRVSMSASHSEEAVVRGEDGSERVTRLFVEDLSATGMRLALAVSSEADQAWPALDEVLELDLPLDDGKGPIKLQAQIVRVGRTDRLPPYGCEVGANFFGLDSNNRERLIRFVLQVQYDRARKGLLRW